VASGRLVTDHADDIARALAETLAEYRDVRVAVLEDLDRAPTRLALGALAPAGSGDAKVEAALAEIGAAIAPSVTAQLTSGDARVHALALSVLAKIDGGKVSGAEAAIAGALDNYARQVRKDPKQVSEDARQVGYAAMNAVVVLAARRGSAPPALVARLVDVLASQDRDRLHAAIALGKLGAKGDPGALIKAAGDPQSYVRTAVAEGLASTAPAIDALLALSRDQHWQVRAAAARSLGTLKDPRARDRRSELVADPHPEVRRAAGGN
jgi:HEAT repeat protein